MEFSPILARSDFAVMGIALSATLYATTFQGLFSTELEMYYTAINQALKKLSRAITSPLPPRNSLFCLW